MWFSFFVFGCAAGIAEFNDNRDKDKQHDRELASQLARFESLAGQMEITLDRLDENRKSVGRVLQQSERALEPLRDLKFHGELQLPIDAHQDASAMASAMAEVKRRFPEMDSSASLGGEGVKQIV